MMLEEVVSEEEIQAMRSFAHIRYSVTYMAAEKKTGPMVMRTMNSQQLWGKTGFIPGHGNTDLQDEPRMFPRVLVQKDSTNVTYCLINAAEHHR